jgi:hypothetical protein
MALLDFKGALEAAALAAPYVRARLNATDINVRHDLAFRSVLRSLRSSKRSKPKSSRHEL